MVAKRFAVTIGAILLIVGLLGFLPGITADGKLLHLFAVNTRHNVVHIITGIVALIVGTQASEYGAGVFDVVLGIVYGLVAWMGFNVGTGMVMGMANNLPDNWLHLLITLFALVIGIGALRRPTFRPI